MLLIILVLTLNVNCDLRHLVGKVGSRAIALLHKRVVQFPESAYNPAMAEPLSNPHDRFFKEIFSRQETARSFLQNYLPQDLTGLLDLSSLEIRKDSFIDPDLRVGVPGSDPEVHCREHGAGE